MDGRQSLGQRWESYNPGKTLLFWSCAASVAATIVVGFNWGGWTTGGTAAAMAKEAASGARQELAAAVCVDRFRGAGDAAAQLATLKGLGNAWDRGTFVEKGGWAAMPGPKPAEPASRAARPRSRSGLQQRDALHVRRHGEGIESPDRGQPVPGVGEGGDVAGEHRHLQHLAAHARNGKEG